MKKLKVLGFIVACFAAIESKAQNQDFYYLQEGKQYHITKVEGSYLVEYPYDSLQPQPAPGKRVGTTAYIVSDTNNLGSYPHYVTSAYKGRGNNLYYTKDIVLQFKENISSTAKNALISSLNLTFVKTSPSYDMYKVVGDALQTSKSIFESGLVDYCHPDFIGTIQNFAYLPNDQFFIKQWYLHNTAQGANDGKSTTDDADIDAPEAWDITKGDSSISVAVLDLGLTSNHPDLPDTRQIRLNGSNYGVGYDGTTNKNDPTPKASTNVGFHGHGNACAGIIAATQDNNQGISGIAPKCKIMPVKLPLLDASPMSIYADAINFAAAKPAKIISISWGSEDPFIPTHLAVLNAVTNNKLVVIAAGNNANNKAHDSGFVQFPANAVIEDVVTVAASDRDNKQANYSPYGDEIELSAPSNTAFPHHIAGETYNLWTMDIPGTNYGYNPWRDTLTPVQLPIIGELLPSYGTNYDCYTGRFGGTSASAPEVAGVAALMMSVNSCMTAKQCKEIMQATADKIGAYDYSFSGHIAGVPKDLGYSKELGYGKVNAYKAVKAAQAIKATANTDLIYMKDNFADVGLIGTGGSGGGDKSPDIWVRDTNDGLINYVHQNPEFSTSKPAFVYVRIRNKSCYDFNPSATSPQQISLYWSKASTWSSWPANWDGTSPFVGNKIASKPIPIIKAGAYTIIEFPWTMLDPNIFKTWNSCLLARIEGVESTWPGADVIKVYAGRLDMDVKENNNIAMRNLTVVDDVKGIRPLGGRVLVGNIENAARLYNLSLRVPNILGGFGLPDITDEAELRIAFDSLGWALMLQAGVFNQQGIEQLPNREILVKDSSINFNNILFPANTRIPLDVSFNFLCDKMSDKLRYEYVIKQSYTDTADMTLGSEHFEINKKMRSPFNANAGNDVTINKGSSYTLSAQAINEIAQYRWFDLAGNLIDTGINLNVAPTNNTNYRLEITSLLDGFKDYDEVEVKVRQHFISNLSPNPASTQFTLAYDAANATTANLQVLRSDGTSYQNYSLNPGQNSISINSSTYPVGIYTLVLYCNGQAADSKTIQIN